MRIVPAAELQADLQSDSQSSTLEAPDGVVVETVDGVEYEVVGADGKMVMRSNRAIRDDPGRQKLTMDEIEELKTQATSAGKDIIARLLSSHSAIDQKTTFSLAKYTLRKTRKYLRRFTVLPLDVPTLAHWLMTEKEPSKILELREEMLALIESWANIHYTQPDPVGLSRPEGGMIGGGRWLVVDETGGLLVAALADRLGILYLDLQETATQKLTVLPEDEDPASSAIDASVTHATAAAEHDHHHPPGMAARHNTLTVLHAHAQPNLAVLKYFLFDSSNPSPKHPLYTHLKSLSWLQLLSPSEDAGYTEPEVMADDVLATWKSGKRGTYYRKRRRWERIRSVVDETRQGGFDGLIIASMMNPSTILQHALPLLRGGAPITIYSPYIEPLAELADLYSTARRAAFLTSAVDPADLPTEDFPLNPALLLSPTVQTAKLRRWQCLPGRTHPLMTARGGAEGYLFTGTRVIPVEGKVEARGKFKKRKVTKAPVEDEHTGTTSDASSLPIAVPAGGVSIEGHS